MAIRIVAKRNGFRRCGIEHSDTPKIYPNDRFTAKQLAKLKSEKMLIVDEISDPPAGKKEKEVSDPPAGKKENEAPDPPAGKNKDNNSGKSS